MRKSSFGREIKTKKKDFSRHLYSHIPSFEDEEEEEEEEGSGYGISYL